MKIIDPHIHLFDPDQGDYYWLKAENPPFWAQKFRIAKRYTDQDLVLSEGFQLAGYVHIEAGFNNAEGHLEFAMLAEQAQFPLKAIGFIDVTLPHEEFLLALKLQSNYAIARGIRHILDGSAKEVRQILENKNTFNNLAFLAERNGIFELQCNIKNTEVVVLLYSFFNRLPELQVVINHAGFPPLPQSEGANARIAGAKQAMAYAANTQINDPNYQLEYTNWQANILLLSQLQKIAVKFSGFEMQQLIAYSAESYEESTNSLHLHSYENYPISDLLQSLLHCLEAFGEDSVMFASNFPLCTFTHTYDQYWQQMVALLNAIPEELSINKNALIYDNAKRIYGFDVSDTK